MRAVTHKRWGRGLTALLWKWAADPLEMEKNNSCTRRGEPTALPEL